MHLSVPQTRLFFGLFFNKQQQLSVSAYLLKFSLSLSRQQPEKKNTQKSRQKFRSKKMQVHSVVQSLECFSLPNLLWRGVAVNKKRTKVKPRFRSFLQALSSEKNLKHRSSPKAIEIRRN